MVHFALLLRCFFSKTRRPLCEVTVSSGGRKRGRPPPVKGPGISSGHVHLDFCCSPVPRSLSPFFFPPDSPRVVCLTARRFTTVPIFPSVFASPRYFRVPLVLSAYCCMDGMPPSSLVEIVPPPSLKLPPEFLGELFLVPALLFFPH